MWGSKCCMASAGSRLSGNCHCVDVSPRPGPSYGLPQSGSSISSLRDRFVPLPYATAILYAIIIGSAEIYRPFYGMLTHLAGLQNGLFGRTSYQSMTEP